MDFKKIEQMKIVFLESELLIIWKDANARDSQTFTLHGLLNFKVYKPGEH